MRAARPGDDLGEHGRVGRDRLEPLLRARRRLVGQPPRLLGAVHRGVPVAVEQVVDDLEEQAELVAERTPRRLLALRHLRDPERDPDGGGEERARLEPVQRGEVGGVAGDVAVLAADHPERRLRELAADHRRRVREREPERLGQQRVAGQERHRLAERDVRGRPSAPLVVVVERGQVVVDERERVHELDRGRRRQARARRVAPAASPTASESTGRTRFPPDSSG